MTRDCCVGTIRTVLQAVLKMDAKLRILFSLCMTSLLIYCCDGQLSRSCYAENENPYVYYASKTAYEFVHNDDSTEKPIRGCSPVQFWMLARHGTRYPGKDDIELMMSRLPEIKQDILRNHKNGRGKLCEKDLEKLKNWKLNINATYELMLANAGNEELEGLARRYKGRFPSLLGIQYSKEQFKFRHTDTQRTEASARAFARGLWGNIPIHIPEPIPEDPLITYYKFCDKWQQEVSDNPNTQVEKNKFVQGSTVSKMITRVNHRLGYIGSITNLTYDDIKLMFDMCRFNKAWDLTTKPSWCAMFSEDDFRVIEYAEDLKYYYKVGYGNSINYEQACPPVQDFIMNFRNISVGEDGPAAILYFAHTNTILSLQAHLGLFQDSQPLQHNNFEEMTERKWRSSFIDPFSSNLATVLYNCTTEYRISFYVQENPVQVRGCNKVLCPLKSVLKEFDNIVEDCDLEKICVVLKSRGMMLSHSGLVLLLVFPISLYNHLL